MPHYRPDSDNELNYPDEDLDAFTDNADISTSEEDVEITQSNVDDSQDAESPDSNLYSNGDNNRYSGSQNTDNKAEAKSKKKGSESARDLVKSQENLILMLQRMKNDLSKMDREATSIKEEVVRSRQLFDVVVAKRRIHQLDQSANGYNLKYAMPKVTYSSNYKRHTDSNWKASSHLCQLSSFHPSSPETSRRSSLSKANRRGSHQNGVEYIRSKIRQDYRKRYKQNSQSELSDTESDCSSRKAPGKYKGLTGNESVVSGISVSGISTDSCDSDSSMTDSSADRISKRLTEYELKRKERRSSYFFEQKTESPQTDLSDGVCV